MRALVGAGPFVRVEGVTSSGRMWLGSWFCASIVLACRAWVGIEEADICWWNHWSACDLLVQRFDCEFFGLLKT